MKKLLSIISVAGAVSLSLAACGDDGGPQGDLADRFIEAFNEFNTEGEFSLDEGCVNDVVGELSDDEASNILDNFDEPDFDGIDTVGEAIEAACFSAG